MVQMNCADAFDHRWTTGPPRAPQLQSADERRGCIRPQGLLGQPSCSVKYASVAPKTGLMTVLRAEKWKWYGGGPRCTLQMKRENASESWRPVGDLDAGCK